MSIILNSLHEQWVKTKVDIGLHASAREVMDQALRLLDERGLNTHDLRQKIQQGIASGEAAPLNFEEIKARGHKRLAEQNRL